MYLNQFSYLKNEGNNNHSSGVMTGIEWDHLYQNFLYCTNTYYLDIFLWVSIKLWGNNPQFILGTLNTSRKNMELK